MTVTSRSDDYSGGSDGSESVPDVYESSQEEESEDEFEDQGSSDEDEELIKNQQLDDDESTDGGIEIVEEIGDSYDAPRNWKNAMKRTLTGTTKELSSRTKPEDEALWMHNDDLSSDDEDDEGIGNRIGRVPLHWYDEYEHIGYDSKGTQIAKSSKSGDLLDQATALSENMSTNKYTVHDALNDRNVTLTERQLELIRRVQARAYAHPEFEGNPDYIDYFSGMNKEISGINSDAHEPKHRFQPSKWEKMQVRRLLDRLEKGDITMDDLTGKSRKDKSEASKEPFLLWRGDEEDELALRKGAQHIPAPKLPPPGHALSYIPPDEYLPSEEDLKEWGDMDVKDRPHGALVPQKFSNLRSVGAYPHSVRDAFERCLDLYLCPRVMKRRLNIDPESLVPKLPKASDLRPFPTAKCIEYKTPYDGEEPPMIRCVSPSPDGQFMASGASDGYVRLWEVQTGRLVCSWDLFSLVRSTGDDNNDEQIKPVVSLEWNPNRNHHCIIAAVGACVVVIATGTAGAQHAEVTAALLASAVSVNGLASVNSKVAKAVQWLPSANAATIRKTVSHFDSLVGPVCILRTNREVTSVKWHRKGDYFTTVSPKAGVAAVLIHQLSKASSQQPFSKVKGEAQFACFHPSKPFLFVATQQHVRVYHLLKSNMVKRLVSGCRWISSMDVHPTGDHLILGSLDRRLIWFDLDLSTTPYKSLRYHERALRSVSYHTKYPLMASASDDGMIHVFHSMVHSDLMRNPLVVPVKILRNHSIRNKLGVLALAFHPTQPWLFSGGSDGCIYLFQDV